MSAPETPANVPARKYVEFSHSFEDPWGADGEETEVKCSYRFAKPNKMQIKRLQAMEDYPGLATTLSGAILKGVGISNELGK